MARLMSNKIKSVFGIVFSEDKKSMLMVKRRDIPIWVFPGGGVEEGETLENACLRELEEETGYSCKIIRKICEYDHKKVWPIRAALFECAIIKGEAKITDETRGINFFPLDKSPKPFLPIFKEFIEHSFLPPISTPQTLKSVHWQGALKLLLLNPIITIRFLLTRIGLHINSK